jgi:EmrB/QacA subfamily drug resistance transporter
MRRILVLAAMVLAVFVPMAANLSVAQVAPIIEGDLGAGTFASRWVVNTYLIVFTALLLAGAALGDRFGRKRMFIWGTVIFTSASAACGLSENMDQLMAARSGQAVGAALLVPATLSILADTFKDKGGGAAFGLWGAMSAAGTLYGQVLGNYLAETYSWNWVFFANVPVGVTALLLATAARESRDRSLLRRMDFAGVLVGGAGLGLLAYALVEGNLWGWRDGFILGSLAAAALLLVVFSLIETRRRHPIVTLWYSGHSTFSGANAVAVATFFALVAIGIFLFAYLTTILGFPTEQAAVRMLPFGGVLLVASPLAGKLSDRLGSRWLVFYGCVLAAGGLALLLQAGLDPAYENVILPALVLAGLGIGLILGPVTAAVVGVVDPGRVGGASGITNAARQVGLLIGLALLGTVVTSAFSTSLNSKMVDAGVDGASAEAIADSDLVRSLAFGGPAEPLRDLMPPGTPPSVLDGVVGAARESFVEGLHSALLLSIGFLLLAALISVVFIRSHVVSLFHVEAAPSKEEDQELEGDSPPDAPSDPAPTPSVPISAVQGAGELNSSSANPETVEPESEPAVAQVLEKENDEPGGEAVESLDDLDEREADLERAEEALVALAADPGAEDPRAPGADLATVLFQLPFKAGSGQIVSNIVDFIAATSPYYQSPVGSGQLVELPDSIADVPGTRTTPDIATLAGYLLLEQRFGRIRPGVRLDLAATALIGSARSRGMWKYPDGAATSDQDFLEGIVGLILSGMGPGREAEAPAPPGEPV